MNVTMSTSTKTGGLGWEVTNEPLRGGMMRQDVYGLSGFH